MHKKPGARGVTGALKKGQRFSKIWRYPLHTSRRSRYNCSSDIHVRRSECQDDWAETSSSDGDKNPIITLESVPFPCNTVFNAAPTRLGDEYILLMRVEDLAGRSVFALARSEDGYHFHVDPTLAMEPSKEEPFRQYERRGIEDPRITCLEGE